VLSRVRGWDTTRVVATGAVVLAVLLPASQAMFYPSLLPDSDAVVGITLTVVFVALHLRHVRYGLWGREVPYGGASLAAMTVVMLVGLVVVGPLWGRMFASLVASSLIVLRAPWSLLVAVTVVIGAGFVSDPAAPVDEPAALIMATVAWRGVTLFVMVWFVASVRRLEAIRAELAADAVRRERERIDHDLHADLERSIANIAHNVAEAETAMAAEEHERVALALRAMTRDTRATLERTRAAVAALRGDTARAELAASARLLAQSNTGAAP
jgi:two-component system sensor histidine kinase DesK